MLLGDQQIEFRSTIFTKHELPIESMS